MDLKTRLRLHRLTRAVYLSQSERPHSTPRSTLLLPSKWSALVLVCVIALLGIIGLSRTISAEAHSVDNEGETHTQSSNETSDTNESGHTHASSESQLNTEQATLIVHVAGAVAHPGVVQLTPGARTIDAIEAAGGALADSDLNALNLAAPTTDGERIYVPQLGEETPSRESDTSAGNLGAKQSSCVDLNTADTSTLQTLDGIGPALAERIVNFRRSSGPFASLEDLDAVPGIGPALLSRIAVGVCS